MLRCVFNFTNKNGERKQRTKDYIIDENKKESLDMLKSYQQAIRDGDLQFKKLYKHRKISLFTYSVCESCECKHSIDIKDLQIFTANEI